MRRRLALAAAVLGLPVLAYELIALRFRCWPTVSDYCPWIHDPRLLVRRP